MKQIEQNKKSTAKNSLTKRELVLEIVEKTGLMQPQVQEVVQLTLDGIVAALDDGRNIEFRDFGVFELVTRKERIGRNPNKPQNVVTIPERLVVKFKPGRKMRELAKRRSNI